MQLEDICDKVHPQIRSGRRSAPTRRPLLRSGMFLLPDLFPNPTCTVKTYFHTYSCPSHAVLFILSCTLSLYCARAHTVKTVIE